MSNLSRVFIVALSSLCPMVGGAGMDSEPVQGQASKLDLQNKPEMEKAPPKVQIEDDGNKLRCWQYGRLIFELRDVESVVQRTSGTDLQVRKGNSGIQVFDMQHGLCILQHG